MSMKTIEQEATPITTMRIPYDKEYVQALGLAVYAFAYYEWGIVYIIEQLQPGFLGEYCREKAVTSGGVYKMFKEVLKAQSSDTPAGTQSLCDGFGLLVKKRNALIHAHPITDKDGSQILNYQGSLQKAISDKKWSIEEIEKFTEEVDSEAVKANGIFYALNG